MIATVIVPSLVFSLLFLLHAQSKSKVGCVVSAYALIHIDIVRDVLAGFEPRTVIVFLVPLCLMRALICLS